jgi:hypothetical protein
MALLILNERNDLFRTAENLEDASFLNLKFRLLSILK